MQCDSSRGLVYISGGKICGSDLCSGLYVYSLADCHWKCLRHDQTSASVSNQQLVLRSAHVMLLHPVSGGYDDSIWRI